MTRMSNHTNRSQAGSPARNPTPEEVRAAREAVQMTLSLGITAAQDWCADQLHVARRTWQSWEYGDRAMSPGQWELLSIKLAIYNVRHIGTPDAA